MAAAFQNRLLSIAHDEDIARLKPHLTRVELVVHNLLEPVGGPIKHFYFVEHGVVSVVAKNNGMSTEIGLIGREGVTGFEALLGDDQSSNEAYAQVPGEAFRIGVARLEEILTECPALKALLLRFVQTFMVQAAHTALANAKGKIEERLARWLLMVQDRIDSRRVEITHQFMATMLGSRRAGVTVALHELEGRGLIRSERGRVSIIDRKGLEAFAGNFYGVPEREYSRIIGSAPGKALPSLSALGQTVA